MTLTLSETEREARHTRQRIAELQGLTPRVEDALMRAQEAHELHMAKIEEAREELASLIDHAACIVQHLGADAPMETAVEMDEPEPTQAEIDAILDDDTPFDFVTVSAMDVYDLPEPATDQMLYVEMASAVEQIADDLPTTEDASDEPEMTNEQVARVEQRANGAFY